MSSAVADRPADAAQQHAAGGSKDPSDSTPSVDAPPAAAHACANCGAPLAAGQDWCVQCGAGAPGSLSSRTPSWRSAAVIVTTLAVLVAGAATAAYAALNKKTSAPPAVTTIARATPPATTTPPAATTPITPTTTPAPSVTTPAIGTPTTIKPTPLPKPAKIPLTPNVTPTPIPKATTPLTTPTPNTNTNGATTPKKASEEVVGEAHPEALMLDTNAASTYNPYNYAASNFGDPSLTIDGDPTTAWTAQVEPSVAPKLAEGVVIDLNTARKLSAATLTTETPGMTVQVYGSDAATLPSSITDPAWVALTPSFVEKKRHVRIPFGHGSAALAAAAKQAYRFVTLWISQAPAASVGSAEAPGHVAVNELELFPRKK
ncbi:MAG TPA: hypothetical protein VN889_07835 [Solirubrobacteraceae bacterium]|nr:hypothetical protein [Solirubrobacteraceae bacterium]